MDPEPRRWHLLRRSRFTVEVWATTSGALRRIGSMRLVQSGPKASVLAWILEGVRYRSHPVPGGRRTLVPPLGHGHFEVPRRLVGPDPIRLARRWGGIEFEDGTNQGGVYDRASAGGIPYRSPVVLNGVILGVCQAEGGFPFGPRIPGSRRGFGRWNPGAGMDFRVELHGAPSDEELRGLQVVLTLARMLGCLEEPS